MVGFSAMSGDSSVRIFFCWRHSTKKLARSRLGTSSSWLWILDSGFEILDFGFGIFGFWDLGILDFGIWGFWILGFGIFGFGIWDLGLWDLAFGI